MIKKKLKISSFLYITFNFLLLMYGSEYIKNHACLLQKSTVGKKPGSVISKPHSLSLRLCRQTEISLFSQTSLH